LVVSGLERGAVLDCSELDAAEVIVTGAITGGSRLAIRAPGGIVRFLAGVEGRSDVDVTTRAVEFQSRIAGAGTRVRVTLTAGGSLGFAEIADPARLEYRKSAPDDPDPAVTRGKVSPPAVVARIE
jgi:hypothetical protein